MDMCRFATRDDIGYKRIVQEIKTFIRQAKTTIDEGIAKLSFDLWGQIC